MSHPPHRGQKWAPGHKVPPPVDRPTPPWADTLDRARRPPESSFPAPLMFRTSVWESMTDDERNQLKSLSGTAGVLLIPDQLFNTCGAGPSAPAMAAPLTPICDLFAPRRRWWRRLLRRRPSQHPVTDSIPTMRAPRGPIHYQKP